MAGSLSFSIISPYLSNHKSMSHLCGSLQSEDMLHYCKTEIDGASCSAAGDDIAVTDCRCLDIDSSLLSLYSAILIPAAYPVDHAICRLNPPVTASRSSTSPAK